MNINVRSKAASGGRKAAAPTSFKDAFAQARAVISTPNGKRVLFLVQFVLSLLTLLYFKGVVKMAYNSMFYRLDIPEDGKGMYCFLVSCVCLLFGALMLFTRRQIVTRVVIMISMPFYLPIILFNYRHLVLLIPLGIMVAVTYIASGTSEAPKTILGALFLMSYILGAFVFLTVQSIMKPAIEETVIQRGVTPGGSYRYSVVQVLDQADGNTYVAVEPNTKDIAYGHSKWYAKGFKKTVYLERPLDYFQVEWTTKTRSEITRELITNNPSTTFTLDADQMRLLGLDKGYTGEFEIGKLSRSQRHKLGYGDNTDPIDSRLRRLFGVTLKDPDFTVTLDFDKMVEIGVAPTYDQRLSRMTDEELALLGVPEENEIMLVNGKVVFRQYVAVLERTFSNGKRDLAAFLEPNVLPEVNEEGLDIEKIRADREAAKAAREAATGTSATTTSTDETTETTVDTTVAVSNVN